MKENGQSTKGKVDQQKDGKIQLSKLLHKLLLSKLFSFKSSP